MEETQIRIPKYLASMLKNVGSGSYANNLQALLESQAFTVDDHTISLLQKHHGSTADISTVVKNMLDEDIKEELKELNPIEIMGYDALISMGMDHNSAIEKSKAFYTRATNFNTKEEQIALLFSVLVKIEKLENK